MGIGVSSSQTHQPDLAVPAAGRRRVLWFHNEANHYFVAMLDALNAQGQAQYVGMFLCPRPEGLRDSALTAIPKNSPFMFLGSAPAHDVAGRTLRTDARALVQAAVFDMAIVGGYDSAFKRWVLAHCRARKIPTAVFADSNIKAEFDGSAKSFFRRAVKKVLLRKIVRQTDQILPANSSGIEYWRYYGCPREKISLSTYYSQVDAPVATDQAGRAAMLQQVGLDPEKRLIFTGARLVRVKGLHLMIEAFGRLGLADKGWVWAIAGGGPLEAELKQQAGALNGHGLYFLGVLNHSQTKALAAGCDVFVLPSTYEPHGIVISEAMGAGTPVIASDACGAAIDLVEPGKTGWLFTNGSADDLQRVLKAATDNPATLADMRPACRAKYEAWYGQYSPLVAVPKVVARLTAGLP